jgi:ankyrin repeat protein/beta-lactamase regulating signal transducer with metallopeptidase domain/Tol biopolymer transport system component
MEPWLIRRADYLLAQSWQIAVLTIAVALASLLLRNRSAHIRYLLWLIVLAKCLVPPLYSIPVAVLPPEEPPVYAPAPPIAERMVAEDGVPKAAVTESAGPASAASDVASSPRVIKRPARYDTRAWLALGWLAGVVALSFYYLLNALRTQVWLQRRRKALPSESEGSIESFFTAHGARRRPRVWLLDRISQPFVWGLVRGSIYLPAGLLDGKHAKFQASLLGHELSHVLRFDAMINSLQVLAQTFFWFHPFVWWANRKIRAEREKCCDEMTIARWNTRPEEYSEAIVETLAAKYEQARPVPSLAVAGQVKNIEERIDTMLRPGKEFYRHPSFPAAAMIVLLSLLAVPTTVVLTVRAANLPPTDSVDADLIFDNPTNLGPSVNSPDDEYDPSISADDLELYFNSNRPGGQGQADLWVATRKTKGDPWGECVNLGPTVNSSAGDKAPCISADGLSLYFSSDRPGGYGGHDLWVTTRKTKTAPWGEPVNLGPTVNSAADEHAPSISTDGLELYFSGHTYLPESARPGGSGESDLWVTRRKTTHDLWGTPVNLGPTVNSSFADASPSISGDGLSLYFNSLRPTGPGTDRGNAIWVTKRKSRSDPWGTPVRLGMAVNASLDGNPDISKDGATLYFSSRRPGGVGGSDIWQATLGKSTPESRAQAQLAASLHEAVKAGDIKQVRLLLAKGANVNAKDGMGYAPLYFAIRNNDPGMVEVLVTKGADVSLTAERNYSLLHFAVWYGDLDTVRLLVDHGAKPNIKDQSGWTALRHAAVRGKRELVEFFVNKGVDLSALQVAVCVGDMARVRTLVEQGANVDAQDELGWTPLYWATCLGRTEVAKLLVADGASVQVAANDGTTPLLRAVQAGDRELVELILSKGADAKAKDKGGWTALHSAVGTGHQEIAELLIAKGADVNAKTSGGQTPLDVAFLRNQPALVKMLAAKGSEISTLAVAARIGDLARVKTLLERGADINAQDNSGRTALHYAAQDGLKEVVEVLLAKGANVNVGAFGSENKTAADFAMESNHSEIVELLFSKGADISALHVALLRKDRAKAKDLIENGADVKKRSPWGNTALHLAAGRGFTDVAELLIAKGADVNAKLNWTWTPLHTAAQKGDKDMVELLVAKGADVNIKDPWGETPLDVAVVTGNRAVVEILAAKSPPVATLHAAAVMGDLAKVKALLEQGADGKAVKGPYGKTAAEYALQGNHPEIVELLIAKGLADVSPLHLAVQKHDLAQARDLLGKGADVNKRTQYGTAPLHLAARAGLTEIAALLIDNGANVSVTDKWNWTPLHDAASNGYKDIVELLIAKGADVNATDPDGRTPLSYAKEKAHSSIVDLLQQHGAKE